jgi:hypothetical protein
MPIPAIALAGAGLASNLIGNIFSGKANRKAQEGVDDQIADLTAWKDTQVNQDPLKSNVGKNIMRKALDTAKQQARTVDSKSAVTGASAEQNIAEKSNIQKGLSNTMSNIAGYATAREDQIEGRYRSNLSQLLNQKTNMQLNKAQQGANVASSAGSFIQGLAPMFADGEANYDNQVEV